MRLLTESDELVAILTSSRKTARGKQLLPLPSSL
jgi:hypothetical protein